MTIKDIRKKYLDETGERFSESPYTMWLETEIRDSRRMAVGLQKRVADLENKKRIDESFMEIRK